MRRADVGCGLRASKKAAMEPVAAPNDRHKNLQSAEFSWAEARCNLEMMEGRPLKWRLEWLNCAALRQAVAIRTTNHTPTVRLVDWSTSIRLVRESRCSRQ